MNINFFSANNESKNYDTKIMGQFKSIIISQYFIKCDGKIVANFMGNCWRTEDDGREWRAIEITE